MSERQPTITTPAGTARYPRLNTPDTTFEDEGIYKCELLVTEEEAGALKKQLDALYKDAFAAKKAELGKKTLTKYAGEVIYQDDEGNWVIKTKRKAQITARDGTVHKRRIALFDSTGAPMAGEKIIGGGSTVKLCVRPKFWFVSALGFGLTLELIAVQVVDFVEYHPGVQTAASAGFTAVEGGYVHGGETFDGELDKEEDGEAEDTEQPLTAKF